MTKLVPIQSIYCSKEDETSLCSFDIEVISSPTTPLIHPMSRLWLINEGEGTLLLNDKKYPLVKGTLVSVLPWQITDIVEVKSPLQFFVMAYYFDNINEIIKTFYNPDSVNLSVSQSMSHSPVVTFDTREHIKMQQLFLQIKDELRTLSRLDSPDTESSPESAGLCKLYITNKLIEIIVSFIRTRHTLPTEEASTKASEIFQYLYTHLNEKITLSALSQQFYMSESAISSYIKGTTGLSFFDLLNEMRVGKTINYLLYTDFTLEELAEILGFVDSAHISKVFLARIGMKANDFRKTYQSIGDKCRIKDRQVFYTIVSYIYRNYAEDLQPKNVSEHFCISPKELNRILLFQVEMNFNDYLNYIRINRACELLLTTDKSILTIALEVGYNNEKTLTRNFLRFRSMTPGKFRRTIELQEKGM
ncbi:MAG: helix-turn-helix transcriptional regulator [Dorea sp.]|nr:helix-turn-helix transcriptional regulator [Dorea sp.]